MANVASVPVGHRLARITHYLSSPTLGGAARWCQVAAISHVFVISASVKI